jgi:hypothetical protein
MTASAGPALREMHAEFGDRIQFLTLYVREAHPGDRYPQPSDLATKTEHARAYADRDGIPWPVAVDDVDGDLHRALDPKPDAVYLVDPDGIVMFRALWANDPGPIREALRVAASGRRGPIGESEAKLGALLRGTGEMWQTLSAAGPVALRDVAKQAPPMWLSARVAEMLRPLPSGLRGAMGMTLPMVAGVGAAAGWRLLRRR